MNIQSKLRKMELIVREINNFWNNLSEEDMNRILGKWERDDPESMKLLDKCMFIAQTKGISLELTDESTTGDLEIDHLMMEVYQRLANWRGKQNTKTFKK